jgi:hypothetical protein
VGLFSVNGKGRIERSWFKYLDDNGNPDVWLGEEGTLWAGSVNDIYVLRLKDGAGVRLIDLSEGGRGGDGMGIAVDWAFGNGKEVFTWNGEGFAVVDVRDEKVKVQGKLEGVNVKSVALSPGGEFVVMDSAGNMSVWDKKDKRLRPLTMTVVDRSGQR